MSAKMVSPKQICILISIRPILINVHMHITALHTSGERAFFGIEGNGKLIQSAPGIVIRPVKPNLSAFDRRFFIGLTKKFDYFCFRSAVGNPLFIKDLLRNKSGI